MGSGAPAAAPNFVSKLGGVLFLDGDPNRPEDVLKVDADDRCAALAG